MRYINNPVGLIKLLTPPYIEWVNIKMLVTEVTENTEFLVLQVRLQPRIHRDLTDCSRLKPLLVHCSTEQINIISIFLCASVANLFIVSAH